MYQTLSATEYRKVSDQLKTVTTSLRDNLPCEQYTEIKTRDTGHLKPAEVKFIRKAAELSSSSRILFSLLASSIICEEKHSASMHLSGFADWDFTFDVEISTYEDQQGTKAIFKQYVTILVSIRILSITRANKKPVCSKTSNRQ